MCPALSICVHGGITDASLVQLPGEERECIVVIKQAELLLFFFLFFSFFFFGIVLGSLTTETNKRGL